MKGSSLLDLESTIEQLPQQLSSDLPWERRFETYITSAFVKHLYKSEDLLFKVIFDRKYRQDMQRNLLRTSRSLSQPGNEEIVLDKARSLRNYLFKIEPAQLSNDQSYRSLQHFSELDYLESLTKTRVQLLYKYPLILCIMGTWYYKRRVVKTHTDLLRKGFYLRVDTPAKQTSNGVQFGLMMVYVANLASFLAGALLSGSQYFFGVKKRYLECQDYELELRRKYINEIKLYHQLLRA
ncbi:hypothetical protein FGO68_gene360 [Halteria grandinella]|uniref:Uncharacterized protein n=1 Tax=Halteria grandinella TaxID=5974 RepID=A0A8J8NQR8_HALGN|nr:hypothetical protein FGO68_gene360 [Halteria grandinella]